MTRRARGLLTSFALLIALAACGRPGNASGDFSLGDPVANYGPWSPREIVWVPTSILSVTGSSELKLVGLTALGLSADVQPELLFMPIRGTNGGLGAFPESMVPEANRAAAHALGGTRVNAAAGGFQLVVRFAMPDHEVGIHGFELRYLKDGRALTVYLPTSHHLCLPDASSCDPIEPYP